MENGYLSSYNENIDSKCEFKRGRPRLDAIETLKKKGSQSESSIKCPNCERVFPRDKSLQTHLRTHTGEKPYPCTFPGCSRKFTQSGQLKTHIRLHTGEKPFSCPVEGCDSKFTHSNRHCSKHPGHPLVRLPPVNKENRAVGQSTPPQPILRSQSCSRPSKSVRSTRKVLTSSSEEESFEKTRKLPKKSKKSSSRLASSRHTERLRDRRLTEEFGKEVKKEELLPRDKPSMEEVDLLMQFSYQALKEFYYPQVRRLPDNLPSCPQS